MKETVSPSVAPATRVRALSKRSDRTSPWSGRETRCFCRSPRIAATVTICAVGKQNLCADMFQTMVKAAMIDGWCRPKKNGGHSPYGGYLQLCRAGRGRRTGLYQGAGRCAARCGALDRLWRYDGCGVAMNTARVEPSSSVVVSGCGGIGLNLIRGGVLARQHDYRGGFTGQ